MILPLTLLAWLERLGGLGLILLGLADNSPIPLPGSMDVLTIILAAHQKSWWPYYASMAIVGSLLGAYLSYELGREGGKETLERKLPGNKAEKIYQKFDKGAFWTLFVPALLPPPFPYSPFLLAAGALNYPRHKFFTAVGLGRAIRYFIVAFLGSRYSKEILGLFRRYYAPFLWALIALAMVCGIGAVIWTLERRRQGKPVIPKKKSEHPRAA